MYFCILGKLQKVKNKLLLLKLNDFDVLKQIPGNSFSLSPPSFLILSQFKAL